MGLHTEPGISLSCLNIANLQKIGGCREKGSSADGAGRRNDVGLAVRQARIELLAGSRRQ